MPCRVSETVAREIAANFDAELSRPRSELVIAAYEQLCAQSDELFRRLTRPPMCGGYIVVFTTLASPYSSDVELIDAVRRSRVLEVATAAADRDRRHPILSGEVGGAYDRFRAVHDLIGHVEHGFGFDRHGEYSAWRLQDRLHRGLARWALATELHGENCVLWTSGKLAEHKAMLLDPALLRRSMQAGDESQMFSRSSQSVGTAPAGPGTGWSAGWWCGGASSGPVS